MNVRKMIFQTKSEKLSFSMSFPANLQLIHCSFDKGLCGLCCWSPSLGALYDGWILSEKFGWLIQKIFVFRKFHIEKRKLEA